MKLTLLFYILLCVALALSDLDLTDWQYWMAMVVALGIHVTSGWDR